MSKPEKETGIWKWLLSNLSYLMAFQALAKVKISLMRANLELGKMDYHNPLYVSRVKEFDLLMIELTRAKWFATWAMEKKIKKYWKTAGKLFKRTNKLALRLLDLLTRGDDSPLGLQEPELGDGGTEIQFAGDAPLVPEICPVVILKGSDFEMGYQYAQQIIRIFGAWILERKAGKVFSASQEERLQKWEQQIQLYAPEIIEMIRGWAQGARDAGVNMSYHDVLDIWTGHDKPKTTYMGKGDGAPEVMPAFACSGAAAWGRATKDGKLVTGSSGDHDPSYPVIIMAYPDTGNNFMYTTFAAAGDIAMVGSQHMFGHPGMNDKGLAYVEHGGQPRLAEPKKYWGYGLRKATAVLHVLRFASSAREALQMELAFPVGDGGFDHGTAGGFYADSQYGFVLTCRKEPVIIREAGVMGEMDFLYANNSGMHPDLKKVEWLKNDLDAYGGWHWDKHAGWYPNKHVSMNLGMLFRRDVDLKAKLSLRGFYSGSARRNQYHFDILSRAVGSIDREYMGMMFRNSGTIPEGSWKKLQKLYEQEGKWGKISVGNASNGIITITKPDEGLYSVCIGQATRGVAPSSAFFASACPVYRETNAFWTVKLAPSIAESIDFTADMAQELVKQARKCFDKLSQDDPACIPLGEFLKSASMEMTEGVKRQSAPELQDLYEQAKTLRIFTRAQVRALQVIQALTPQPDRPEDLI